MKHFLSSQRKYQSSVQPLCNITEKFLAPLLYKHGKITVELVKAWKEIVGSDYKMVTRPEKIIWSRQRNREEVKKTGCLVVACEPSNAIYLQHEIDNLRDRINDFFGCKMINNIKIEQKPILVNLVKNHYNKQEKLCMEKSRYLDKVLVNFENKKLRKALYKLGYGVMLRHSNRKLDSKKNIE